MDFADKKLFIFDLDGTLADVYHAIYHSLNYTRRKFGHAAVTFRKAKQSVGIGDRHFVSLFFPAHELERALTLYRQVHAGDIAKYARVLPYVKPTLAFLRKQGAFIAVASNRPHYFTQKVLKTIGIVKYIDTVLCADDIKAPKPDPKMLNLLVKKFAVKKRAAVYCGDMDIDLKTARRAGIDAVFVQGGSSPVSVAKHYPGVRVIRSFKSFFR